LIIHKFLPKKGIVVLTAEDEDDLWVLRRLVNSGDSVTTDTTRIVKHSGDFVRPNKGERIHVTITLEVESIHLDNSLSRLRVFGRVLKASDEMVGIGSHHSFIVTPDKLLEIVKQDWNDLTTKIIQASKGAEDSYLLVTIDRREAGVGRVKGTHLHIYPTIYSDASGKAYGGKSTPDSTFYRKVSDLLESIVKENESIYVAGPGSTKNAFINIIKEVKGLQGRTQLVEGVDLAGEDGVRMVLKSPALRKLLAESKLAKVSSLLEAAITSISRNDGRLMLGLNENNRAADLGAVEALLLSDQAFSQKEEDKVFQLLNRVESRRGRVYLVDASTELGVQISSLSGIVGILRFPILS
jgi:protein pelota